MDIINTSELIVELAKKGMTVELQEMNMKLREEALELSWAIDPQEEYESA